MNQISFPTPVAPAEISRQKTLGAAIALCANAAGLEPKQITDKVKTSEGKGVDKAAWSRWVNDAEGIEWCKLVQVMDQCGNDAPLLWMLHARGYDLASLRKRETETERELRVAREEIERLKAERDVERRLFRDLRVSA